MIDPTLSLAVSMQASKGVYALLVGSGISKSAGIPIGWDIVLDLVRKLAAAKGEDCEPDPESWYRRLTGTEPDYSQILDYLTLNGAERVQLLRSYFEPTEEERQQGRKMPTRAHRAIAKLVAKGYVRVIVTTNFDRLIEQALSDEGLQPTVISTIDAVSGALPIMHSTCTVIKVHGDYLDTRLRNTTTELAAYDPILNDYLDRVLDEFGMVVCGWSVRWDPALRGAIERCRARRFATYWTAYGALSPEAQKLVDFRGAQTINISDADSFFVDLEERVQAVESYATTDPVSPRVAVARLKRYLSNADQRINLHDFIVSESERAYKGTRSDRFSTGSMQRVSSEDLESRLRAYESEVHTLLPVMICGAFWSDENQHGILLESLKRIADGIELRSGSSVLLNMRRYPALLLLYGLGISATYRRKYHLLRKLFDLPITTGSDESKPVLRVANTASVMSIEVQRQLPNYQGSYTALSDHLFELLREPFRDYVPDDVLFDEAFDWFEYLLGLVFCDQTTSPEELTAKKEKKEPWRLRAPYGRFLYKCEYGGRSIQKETELQRGQMYPGKVSALLHAGFFGSDRTMRDDRYEDIKLGYDTFIAAVRAEIGIIDLS